jgi:Adenylate and Guanylate cyclase catalytic domain/Double zinc ribbon
MTCPRCKRPSPPGAKFCVECGAPLALACGKCGTPVPAGARFCPECAHPVAAPAEAARFGAPQTYTPRHLADKILTSRSALEGERKQVTVLFADVSGFTSLSAQLDPEDAHVLMNQAFELMLDEVHRYEGTVNQFLGDGIMALFGAPIAHEEHAQRAAHAALGIQRRLDELGYDLERRRGIAFQVRQGATPASSWSGRLAPTCGWTTRRSATRPTSPPGSSRSQRPAAWSSPRPRTD